MDKQVYQDLDEEFNAVLSSIKFIHLSLLTTQEKELCHLWLSKLEASLDKCLRIKFLEELAKQIKEKKLRYPFTEYPPEGSLWNINNGDITEDFTDGMSYSDSDIYNEDELSTHDEEGINVEQIRKNKSIYTSCEPNFSSTAASLKAENNALRREVNVYQMASKRNEKKVESVFCEVEDLKQKLKDLQKVNKTIEEGHTEVINDYKLALTQTTRDLSQRLELLSRKNEEIESALNNLKKKYRDPSPLRKKAQLELIATVKKLSSEFRLERARHKAEVEQLKSSLAEKDCLLAKLNSKLKRYSKIDEETSSKRNIRSPTKETIRLKEKVCELQSHVEKMSKTNSLVERMYKYEVSDYQSLGSSSPKARMVKTPEKTSEIMSTMEEMERKYRKIIRDIQERHDSERTEHKKKIRELEERFCPCRY